MLYVTRMTQNKNDSIKSKLQHGRVVGNNCCIVFPTSRFPYLILCRIFEDKNLLLLKPPQITRSSI